MQSKILCIPEHSAEKYYSLGNSRGQLEAIKEIPEGRVGYILLGYDHYYNPELRTKLDKELQQTLKLKNIRHISPYEALASYLIFHQKRFTIEGEVQVIDMGMEYSQKMILSFEQGKYQLLSEKTSIQAGWLSLAGKLNIPPNEVESFVSALENLENEDKGLVKALKNISKGRESLPDTINEYFSHFHPDCAWSAVKLSDLTLIIEQLISLLTIEQKEKTLFVGRAANILNEREQEDSLRAKLIGSEYIIRENPALSTTIYKNISLEVFTHQKKIKVPLYRKGEPNAGEERKLSNIVNLGTLALEVGEKMIEIPFKTGSDHTPIVFRMDSNQNLEIKHNSFFRFVRLNDVNGQEIDHRIY